MEKLVIVGGGIAGLSCLNALLDLGESPLLLEGASIGTPKMCGEFLAPPALAQLNTWGIGPIQAIEEANFSSNQSQFKLPFPRPAGAIARSSVEVALAQRAIRLQGRIREKAMIQEMKPGTSSTPYTFNLQSGEIIQAQTVIFATGKFGQVKPGRMQAALPYFGIKLHFKHIVKPATLLMYSVKDAYLGIVPISDEESNCACLVKREVIEKQGSCKTFFNSLLESNPALQNVFEKLDFSQLDWFESPAPEFQMKKLPSWPRSFWIGDALAGLYPAIGSGFSHSINSALLAAEYYALNKSEEYLKVAKQQLRSKILIGKLMHQIMLKPGLASVVFPFLQFNPWILGNFLRKLDY